MTMSPTAAFGPDLGYAQNGLDRLSSLRENDASLAALWAEPTSVTAVLVGDLVLLRSDGGALHAAAEPPLGSDGLRALLGRAPDGGAVFACSHQAGSAPETGVLLRDLRTLALEGQLPVETLGALAQAKALFHWHRTHGYCANCGAGSEIECAGWRRRCATCGTLHFPRTDPVVIMMAVEGDRCLLGRQPRFPPGMYSCLAGFVEPGETIEDAVRREIAEEAGIQVGPVRYLGSQPWPFPASIMIGCIGEAVTSDIRIDFDELEDARWVSRSETRAILEGRSAEGLVCPPRMAIANHLMRSWAYGD